MVVLGVDPHKKTHTVVAADDNGRSLGEVTIKARPEGYLALLRWVARFGEGRRWGVEDGRQYAGALLRVLIGAGEQVALVPPKLMAGCRDSARTRGKSDPIDALAVARAVLREPDLPTAWLDESSLSVRLLVDHREDLIAQRTATINRLRLHLVALDPDLEPPVKTLTRRCVLARLTTRLAALPVSTRRDLALDLVEQIEAVSGRIGQLDREIAVTVAPIAPHLLAVVGVGPITAAKLIGEVGGIGRFPTAAKLARLAGIACIPVWSGNRERYRLDRGGNRQLNTAFYRIAITQIRCHPPAQTLHTKRLEKHNDTKAGAIRVLKRHLVDIVYTAMKADAALATAT